MQLCEQANTLLTDIKICKQDNDRSGRTPDITGALNHLDDDHSDLLSISGTLYACALCNVESPTEELFWGHLALVNQTSGSHIAVGKSYDMFYSVPAIVQSCLERKGKGDHNYGT